MKLLIVDFLRRWWLLLLGFVVIALVSTVCQWPVVLTFLIYIALDSDRKRGLPRAVVPLPVSRREQALASWFIGVLLLPLIALAILPLGVAMKILFLGSVKGDPWFTAVVTWWFSLGLASIMFIVYALSPGRIPSSFREWLGSTVAAFAIPVCIFLTIFAPMIPGHLKAIHWMMFAAVPVLVALSFWMAPGMFKQSAQPCAARQRSTKKKEVARGSRGGLTGMSLLVAKLLVVPVCTYVGIVVLTWLIALISTRPGSVMLHMQKADHQLLMYVVMIGGVSVPNLIELRMARVMPISTGRLIGLLVAPVALISLTGTLLTCFLGTFNDSPAPLFLNGAARFAMVTGLGVFMVTFALAFSQSASAIGMMMAVVFASAAFDVIPKQSPGVVLLLGLSALLVSMVWLQHTLRKSLKPYRPRRLWGMPQNRSPESLR